MGNRSVSHCGQVGELKGGINVAVMEMKMLSKSYSIGGSGVYLSGMILN